MLPAEVAAAEVRVRMRQPVVVEVAAAVVVVVVAGGEAEAVDVDIDSEAAARRADGGVRAHAAIRCTRTRPAEDIADGEGGRGAAQRDSGAVGACVFFLESLSLGWVASWQLATTGSYHSTL